MHLWTIISQKTVAHTDALTGHGTFSRAVFNDFGAGRTF